MPARGPAARAAAERSAGQLGAAPLAGLGGQRQHVRRQPDQRHRGQVRPGVEAVLPGGPGQAQPFEPGEPGRDALQERLARDAVPGGEALGDRVRQLVQRALVVVGAPPRLQQRRLVPGPAERREQEAGQLAGRPQVGVPHRRLDRRPVLDRVEGQVGTGGQPVADDRPGAPVVDAVAAQPAEQAVGAGRAHARQPGRDQPPVAAARGQQGGDDLGGVVVVDVERERRRVQVGVVAVDVAVQEAEGEPLLAGRAVELALPGGGDRRVGEQQQVLAADEVGVGLHGRSRDVRGPAGEWGRELRSNALQAGSGSRTGVPRPVCFRTLPGAVRASHRI
ncbi:hypothetical protein MF672_045765 [Actinomadura sp. ATCC 31491]|uniref:Uncharacterized protein n=1 Tax=Actinomadura luzonensis TaxID=2805427 RepID=A0ABT0G8Y4_9ACTN|nr:hypothetical protein [Actinomadura luzonensis]MCK2221062.1 hypothetical protein [Actinomadura luzonensis]